MPKSFKIPLVKEGGRLSNQTFTVQIDVSNMTTPYEPATFDVDFTHQRFSIEIFPHEQTVWWEFELIHNKAPEENEAFRVSLISSGDSPTFLTDSRDVFNETLVVINDPQSLFNFYCIMEILRDPIFIV